MQIKCPACQQESSDEQWDKATIDEFGEEDIVSVTSPLAVENTALLYACPKCDQQVPYFSLHI